MIGKTLSYCCNISTLGRKFSMFLTVFFSLSLLQKMLHFDPSHRISASEAMKHAYFQNHQDLRS